MLETYIDIWLAAGENYRRETAAAVANLRCVYCGDQAQTFDHIVPRAAGGPDTYENLAPVCRPCNGAKAARSLGEWSAAIRMEIGRLERRQRQLAGIERLLAAGDAALPSDHELSPADAAELDALMGDAA